MDLPANPPDCLGSTSDTIVSSTHSMTIDSKTVAAIGVSDIGRMPSRLLGVQITDNQETLVFINVYLPFPCEDNYEKYLNYLSKLTALVEELATSNIVVIGDFNATKDIKFENERLHWCKSNNFIMSDKGIIGDEHDTQTYVSDR